jgi:hypothetical protein
MTSYSVITAYFCPFMTSSLFIADTSTSTRHLHSRFGEDLGGEKSKTANKLEVFREVVRLSGFQIYPLRFFTVRVWGYLRESRFSKRVSKIFLMTAPCGNKLLLLMTFWNISISVLSIARYIVRAITEADINTFSRRWIQTSNYHPIKFLQRYSDTQKYLLAIPW